MEVSKEAKAHLDDVYEGVGRLFRQLRNMRIEGWKRTMIVKGDE